MARTPVLAAGGIVLRQAETPLIALVRLRKRDEWVLPKGKLDDGETPRAAAEREVQEETGHNFRAGISGDAGLPVRWALEGCALLAHESQRRPGPRIDV